MDTELRWFGHTLSKDLKQVRILPFGDFHYGNPLCSLKHAERAIKFVKDNEDVYMVLTGDLCEAITVASKGNIYKQLVEPEMQRDFMIEFLTPIKHKILGMVTGNHEMRIKEIDISKDIAKALNVPYRPEGILLKISFGDNNNFTQGKPYTYWIYATHGYGGARTKSAKAVKVERVATWIHADCLHPNTTVLRGNLQWAKLGDIKVGDELIGIEENPQFNRCRRVIHTNVTYVQNKKCEAFKLFLSDGTVFITTPEHLWLTKRRHDGNRLGGRYNWYPTSELSKGDLLLRVFDVWTNQSDWESGYIAGLLDGEGSITVTTRHRNRQLCFTQKEGMVLKYFEDYLIKNDISYYRYKNINEVINLVIRTDAPKLVGLTQPLRLEKKARDLIERGLQHPRTVSVEHIEPCGEQDVVRIETDKHTFIAEGIATHNCYVMAHDHVVSISPDVYLSPDNRGTLDKKTGFFTGAVTAKRKMLIKSNAYLKWGSYSEQGGFPPVDLEPVVIYLAGKGKPRVNVGV